MTTDKTSIARLVEICHHHGLRDIVFSPGSRNAALIIAFTAHKQFNCLNIPDERVAAFFAMGISLKKQIPAIICCTSGTAVLNYAPAICEAYYQKIPMLILTADRPVKKIDQGVGQSMRQKEVYANYIEGSYELIEEAQTIEDIESNDAMIAQAISLSLTKRGPVHINIPFEEPLYGLSSEPININFNSLRPQVSSIPDLKLSEQHRSTWKTAKRKLVIVGQGVPDKALNAQLVKLSTSDQILLMTETCSNIYAADGIQCIDRVINSVSSEDEQYIPDLIVYIGGQIISKNIKKLFSKYSSCQQWYVNTEKAKDTFGNLSEFFKTSSLQFINQVQELESINSKDYTEAWNSINTSVRLKHQAFLSDMPFSDFAVFEYLLRALPQDCNLHLSNSTVVRYAQLFDQRKDLQYFANRGVSGIDGCTSTAMGYAFVSDKLNVLITGDMSFLYDSNAFWHRHKPTNFKVILINNNGGGIFRIIDGPSQSAQLEEHFETVHNYDALHLSKMYNLEYDKVNSLSTLKEGFNKFINSPSEAIQLLEVQTPRTVNDKVLKDYFKKIKVQ